MLSYAAGQLEPERSDGVEAHLGECAMCRQVVELAPLRALLRGMEPRPVPPELLEGFTAGVMSQVASEVSRGRLARGLYRAAGVLGIALLLALALARQPDPTAPTAVVATRSTEPARDPVAPAGGEAEAPLGMVAMKSPVAEIFLSPDNQVVFVVLDTDEEL